MLGGGQTVRTEPTPRGLEAGHNLAMAASQICSSDGCANHAAFSTRTRPTWCESCVDEFYRAGGMEPLEPFTTTKAHRRSRCLTCGHITTARFEYVLDKSRWGEPVCRVCHWEAWAERGMRVHRTELDRVVWAALATDPTDPELAHLIETESTVREAVARVWWPTPRTEALFDKLHHDVLVDTSENNDGTHPVITRCRLCGHISVALPARMGSELSGRWCACQVCHQRNGGSCAQDVAMGFELHGMHVATPLAKVDSKQEATCARCGSPRAVSLGQLNLGQVPCYVCDGGADPYAEHRVYLFHFPAWGCFKVGITNAGNDSRLVAHQRNGGELVELITVLNRAAALWVEARVLSMVTAWPATGEPVERRVVGWTEMWDRASPVSIHLQQIAARLPTEFAPTSMPARPGATELAEMVVPVKGATVCFTGTGAGRTRTEWVRAAEAAGLVPVGSVSERLGMLVVPDASTDTSKTRKAIEAGVPIVDYYRFAQVLGATTTQPPADTPSSLGGVAPGNACRSS